MSDHGASPVLPAPSFSRLRLFPTWAPRPQPVSLTLLYWRCPGPRSPTPISPVSICKSQPAAVAEELGLWGQRPSSELTFETRASCPTSQPRWPPSPVPSLVDNSCCPTLSPPVLPVRLPIVLFSPFSILPLYFSQTASLNPFFKIKQTRLFSQGCFIHSHCPAPSFPTCLLPLSAPIALRNAASRPHLAHSHPLSSRRPSQDHRHNGAGTAPSPGLTCMAVTHPAATHCGQQAVSPAPFAVLGGTAQREAGSGFPWRELCLPRSRCSSSCPLQARCSLKEFWTQKGLSPSLSKH